MRIDDRIDYQIDKTRKALNGMKNNYPDDEDFNDSLRFFLDNAYRILEYMERLYKKNPLFEKWHEEEFYPEKIEGDTLIMLFKKMLRGYDVHESPLQHFVDGINPLGQIEQRCSCNEIYNIPEPYFSDKETKTIKRFYQIILK